MARDSFIVPADQEIKEQTLNEPLNAKFSQVNEALETPGDIRSSCQITDTDSEGREHLNDVNEKISVKLRQTETDNNIHQAHLLDLEAEPEWITKIKTFKITKVWVLSLLSICKKLSLFSSIPSPTPRM